MSWQIDGKRYDLREFSRVHPGGRYAITLSSGYDVTDLFHSYHTADKLKRIAQYEVPTVIFSEKITD